MIRRALFTLLAFYFVAGAIGQTVLKYETHAIETDSKNAMKLTDYMEGGSSGRNVIWDFTALQLKSDFEGSAEQAGYSDYASYFQQANVVVQEFGNYFFFQVSQQGIQQYGFLSADKKTLILYDVPFVKMKFPFSYGNSFQGDYHGTLTNECNSGTISGNYKIEADGLGSLLLPGDVSYDNVLRVKETKIFTETVNDKSTDVEMLTYRWYINENPYPIMALISKTFHLPDGNMTVSNQAAYNDIMISQPGSVLALNSLAGENNFNAFPNPFSDRIAIEFELGKESGVSLSLFNMNGQLIKELAGGKLSQGKHSVSISGKELNLAKGTYLLKLIADGVETSLKIVKQ